METMDLVTALDDAIRIIKERRIGADLASGALAVWEISAHAEQYLNAQVEEMLRPTESDKLNADLRASVKRLCPVPPPKPVSVRGWSEEDERLYREQVEGEAN